jgi:predicted lipoprotein with Yx(FWY)xxD motif
MKRKFGWLAVALTFALLVAACGGSDDDSASNSSASTRAKATTTTEPATTTTPTTAPPTAAATASTVKTASTTLGTVLVDASGKTLYAFANDQGTTSACTGGCLGIWPPLMATSPTGGTGIDATKLSAAPSGQVVYGGHLLYTYTPDTAAGETKGQGVGGVWHVVAPSGDIIS